MRFPTLCATVLGALAPSAPSFAAAPGDTPAQIVVHTSDLNLQNDTGVTRLYARLDHAARVVCGDGTSRELARIVAARRCVQAALRGAVDGVHLDGLTRTYARYNAASAG
jgi:UrcA family protein